MKKAILLLCIASALCGKSVAQSVVSSAGGSTDMLTWTLGEVFTESVMRSNVVRFSQGFNQPIAISTSGILNIKGDNVTFTAGPNPVVDELYLSVSGAVPLRGGYTTCRVVCSVRASWPIRKP